MNCYKCYLIRIFAISTMMILSFGAFAQRGEKSLGFLGGFNTRTECAVAGIYFQYRFNSWLRIAPDVEFLIQRNNVSSYTFNVDMQFPLLGTQRANIYPLAGLSYQSWRLKTWEKNFNDNDLGIDVGAGAEYKFTTTFKGFMQWKYTFLKDNPSWNFMVGLGYCF